MKLLVCMLVDRHQRRQNCVLPHLHLAVRWLLALEANLLD